ncbi:hypothetical protein, partial [Heyndrickxia sporothermodurans]
GQVEHKGFTFVFTGGSVVRLRDREIRSEESELLSRGKIFRAFVESIERVLPVGVGLMKEIVGVPTLKERTHLDKGQGVHGP